MNHSQAKDFIRNARLNGFTINVRLNQSTADLNRAIDTQYLPQFEARKTSIKALATQAAIKGNKRTMQRNKRAAKVRSKSAKIITKQFKKFLKPKPKSPSRIMHYLEIKFHFNGYSRSIYVWAPLTKDDIDEIPPQANRLTADVFATSGFVQHLGEPVIRMLGNSYQTIVSVPEHKPAPNHEMVALSWKDTVLEQNTNTHREPWIVSDYAVCGDVRHAQRKNSCLINAILGFKNKVGKKRSKYFENEYTLYEYIKGVKVGENDNMPLTLYDCEDKIFKQCRIACRVIDKNDNLVYRFDDSTAVKNGRTLRLVVDGNHCHPVRADKEHSFDQICGNANTPIKPTVELKNDLESSLRNTMYCSNKKREAHAFVRTLDDITIAIEQHKDDKEIKCLSLITDDAEAVLLDVLKSEHNIRPDKINNRHAAVNSFLINFNDRKCYIHEFTPSDTQIPAQIASLKEYNAIADGTVSINKLIFDKRLKSRYSPDNFKSMKNFYRTPVCGSLFKSKSTNFVGFDVAKCYTSHLMKMTLVPVFSYFDDFRPVNAGHRIEEYSKYQIEVKNPDPIFMERDYNVVYGFTLRELDRKSYKILGILRPHRLENLNPNRKPNEEDMGIRTQVKKIYENSNLTEANKKSILNTCIGVSGKRYNRAQKSQYVSSTQSCCSTYRKFGDGYLSIQKSEVELTDGFCPINEMILERNRIMIKRMHDAIKKVGVPVIAIKTDCVFIEPNNEALAKIGLIDAGFKFATPDMSAFDSIGLLKLEYKEFDNIPQKPLKTFQIDYDQMMPYVCEHTSAERITMKSETYNGWDNEEYAEHFPQTPDDPNIMFSADCPGAGKTWGVKNYFKGRESELLIITSWNRLRCEMAEQGKYMAITKACLFGERPAGPTQDAVNQPKPYDLTGVKHIHFEEPYLYSIAELEKIENWLMMNNDMYTFSCSGDSYQLPAIGQTLSSFVDYDEYHDSIFASMFPKRMTLKWNKRCKTYEDAISMYELCQQLKKCKSGDQSMNLLIKAGFNVIDGIDNMPNSAKDGAHVSFKRSTTDDVNNWCHAKRGEAIDVFRVNDKLLGKPHDRSLSFKNEAGTGRVHVASNALYWIMAHTSDGQRYKIKTDDDKVFWVSRSELKQEFSRPYCCTCHSSQGLSLGTELYIHDFGNFALSPRWYYTAFTRASSMNITFVRN